MKAPAPARVLYVVSLFPCWSETFIVREIAALLARGVDVRILSLKHPCESMVQPDAAAMLGRVWHPQPRLRAWWSRVVVLLTHPLLIGSLLLQQLRALWRQPLVLLKSIYALLRGIEHLPALRSFDPDFIHAHWATYPSTVALALARLERKPWGFTCHAHDIFVDDQLLAEKLVRADLPVTISRYNVDYLSQRVTSEAGRRLQVIHCGVELSGFPYVREGRSDDLLVAVGRLDPIKGFDVLLHALARLKADGVAFHCRIIGEGPQRPVLENLIAEMELGKQVELCGARPQSEVRELLNSATLFVLPSTIAADGNRDGIPVALMEAMAVGTPVVSARTSGIPELIVDEGNGLLADAGDAAGLAAAIRRMLDDETLRERCAKQARATIEQSFDAGIEADKLMQAMGVAMQKGAVR